MSPELAQRVEEGSAPWERLKDEGDAEFFGFQNFRDALGMRSLSDTGVYVEASRLVEERAKEQRICRLTGKPVPPDITPEDIAEKTRATKNSSYTLVWKWSKAHLWRERVRLYDDHLDRRRIRATEKEVNEMVTRHLSISGLMQNKALRRLQQMDDGDLTPRNVLDYLIEGIKIERTTREPAPVHGNVRGTVKPEDLPEHVEEKSTAALDTLKGRIVQIAQQKQKAQQEIDLADSEDDIEV